MAVYNPNPKLLVLFASVTNQTFIDPYTGAPLARPHIFTEGDGYTGEVYVLDQITGPTAYNFYLLASQGSKLALTDGLDTTYAAATAIAYVATPYPKLTFALTIASAALTAAFAALPLVTNIPAYFEFLCSFAGAGSQKEIICNDPVQIFKSALVP